jgi:hypothetical protein
MKMTNSFETQLRKKGQLYADADKVVATQRLARRVSQYARKSPAEFTAETKAALSLGKKYDNKVMGLYREITGERLPSVKSQQRQQGVTGSYVSPRAKRRPKSTTKAAAAKPAKPPKAAKPASKVDTSMSGLARRRARANAPRNSTYLSQKLNSRSAVTRSAANAIYNEQRKSAKTLFGSQLPAQIARVGLIGKGLSGSKRERAEANREAARKRVVGGRRR